MTQEGQWHHLPKFYPSIDFNCSSTGSGSVNKQNHGIISTLNLNNPAVLFTQQGSVGLPALPRPPQFPRQFNNSTACCLCLLNGCDMRGCEEMVTFTLSLAPHCNDAPSHVLAVNSHIQRDQEGVTLQQAIRTRSLVNTTCRLLRFRHFRDGI